MKGEITYRRRFDRLAFYREWMAGRALRRRKPDFNRERPMVSIIGDYLSDQIRAEQIYEREILEFVRDRILDLTSSRNQTAIDVGANIGNHSLFLSDLFARVIAFEPNALTRAILQLNLGMNNIGNVEIRPVGLSDHNASATLRFDPINLGAASSSDLSSKVTHTHETRIELAVGDQVLDQSEPIGLIKVDVEGAEEAVLRGLEQTLRKHSPIVMIEQWPDVIDRTSGTSPSFLFLQDLGYSAWEIERSRLFRGKLGRVPTLLLGRVDYYLSSVSRLQMREYPALIFIPSA